MVFSNHLHAKLVHRLIASATMNNEYIYIYKYQLVFLGLVNSPFVWLTQRMRYTKHLFRWSCVVIHHQIYIYISIYRHCPWSCRKSIGHPHRNETENKTRNDKHNTNYESIFGCLAVDGDSFIQIMLKSV